MNAQQDACALRCSEDDAIFCQALEFQKEILKTEKMDLRIQLFSDVSASFGFEGLTKKRIQTQADKRCLCRCQLACRSETKFHRKHNA